MSQWSSHAMRPCLAPRTSWTWPICYYEDSNGPRGPMKVKLGMYTWETWLSIKSVAALCLHWQIAIQESNPKDLIPLHWKGISSLPMRYRVSNLAQHRYLCYVKCFAAKDCRMRPTDQPISNEVWTGNDPVPRPTSTYGVVGWDSDSGLGGASWKTIVIKQRWCGL